MAPSFYERLPKLELHAHLNGSLTVETLKELRHYNQQNGKSQIDDKTWSEWEKGILHNGPDNLEECFELFKVAHSVTNNPEAVKLAAEKVIQEFANDNVAYLELRSTLREESNMSKEEYIKSLIDAVKNSKNLTPGIEVKLIISINRRDSVEDGNKNVKLAIEYYKSYPEIIAGVDLSGDPSQKSFRDFLPCLENARKEGLKITIHCGEIPKNEEVEDILNFKPERLGHCTCIHERCKGNLEIWKQLLESKIPVEICLTSNIKCRTVSSYSQHHLKYLYEARHPFAICTDDKGVFGTSLSQEYKLAAETFNFSDRELWKITFDSIKYTFASENGKKALEEFFNRWKDRNEF